MNTTPDTPKAFDDTGEEKVCPQSPGSNLAEEDNTDFEKAEVEVLRAESGKDEPNQEEDRFLESIAIKGKGWKRLKYMFTMVGIAISIITRYFLVDSC
jgi:hypothetical protein